MNIMDEHHTSPLKPVYDPGAKTITTFSMRDGVVVSHTTKLETIVDNVEAWLKAPCCGGAEQGDDGEDHRIVGVLSTRSTGLLGGFDYRTCLQHVPPIEKPRTLWRRVGYFGCTLAARAEPTPARRLLWALLTMHVLRLWWWTQGEWAFGPNYEMPGSRRWIRVRRGFGGLATTAANLKDRQAGAPRSKPHGRVQF